MNRGLGCKRSHPAKLARRVSLERHPLVRATLAAGALPSSFDLGPWQPPILDQGQSGSCTRGSTSSAYYTAFNAAGQALGFIPSQREGYATSRAYERALATQVGQPLPLLTDSGAELADVFHCDAEFGVKPMAVQTTPDGRAYDIWTDADTSAAPSNVNDEPDLGDLMAAGQRLVVGPYAIDLTASNASDVVAAALVAKLPVEMAFFCDSAFQQLSPGQVAGAPNTSDPNGGGHAVYFSGFQTENSARVFTLTNSWGSGWCNGGRCLVGEAWLRAAWEAWPMSVSLAVGRS